MKSRSNYKMLKIKQTTFYAISRKFMLTKGSIKLIKNRKSQGDKMKLGYVDITLSSS